jgi:hypothetical protein
MYHSGWEDTDGKKHVLPSKAHLARELMQASGRWHFVQQMEVD